MVMIYSVINNKGGTGKTTTVLNLGAALSMKKKRVLLVDLDAQGNLTSGFGMQGSGHCVGEVLLGRVEPQEAICDCDGVALLPASGRLLDYERELEGEPGREFILREKLDLLADDYDYIFVDCPPSLSTLSVNSLVAANRFIIPMQAENFAFIGLNRILQVAEKVKQRMNPSLALAGVLFVKFNPRTKFSKGVIASLSQNPLVVDKLFATYIRQDVALMESTAFRQHIFHYAPKSRGADDFRSLAKELIKQEKAERKGEKDE